MLEIKNLEGTQAAEQLVSRLKVMAELDIGERRLPQDGRFKLRMQGREIDFRLSIMPSVFGEDAVVRVLDRAQIQAQGQLTLDALGFEPEARAAIRALARQPHGMLLVTGPTAPARRRRSTPRSPRSTPAATRSSRSRTRSSTSCPASCRSPSTRRRA